MAPALAGDFVLDDHGAVVGSACVTGALRPDLIFGSNFWCQLGAAQTVDAWRPFVVATWWLLWHVGGGSALPFHVTGVLVHAVCTLQVARLAVDLGIPRPAATLGACLFAVLPIHVDAVASVVGQADVWSTLFLVLALRAWLRGRWWTLAFAALAVLSKESGVVVLPALIVLELLGPHGTAGARTRRVQIVCVGITVLALLAARAAVLGAFTGAHVTATVNPLLAQPWIARIPAAFDLAWRYARLTALGFPLSADYSFAAVRVGEHVDVGGVALGVGLLAVVVVVAIRRWRQVPVRFSLLWLLLGFGFISNVPALLPAIMAERLLYGPSVPLCFVVGTLLLPPFERSRAARAAALAYMVVQGGLAAWHCTAWTTEDRITATTVAHSPRSARAHAWRARVLSRAGDAVGAQHHASAAIEILPGWAAPRALLAAALDVQGHPEAALPSFRRALDLDAADPEVADLFIQFLLRYGHGRQAALVHERHRLARGGEAAPQVTVPPHESARLPP